MKNIKGFAKTIVTALYCFCCSYYCLFALYNTWFGNVVRLIGGRSAYLYFSFGDVSIGFGFLVLHISILACILYSILFRKRMNTRRVFFIWGLPLLFFLSFPAIGISPPTLSAIACFILALVLIAEAVYAVWLAVTKRVV